jgi:hypothetical protein
MKKAIAMGLAAIVAAGAFAIVPTEASAGSGYYWQTGPGPHPNWGYPDSYYPYYPRHRHSGAYFSFGGPDFRFSFGVPVYPMHPYHTYRYAYANPHTAWCAAHFRTYNRGNNMYFAKKGVMVACNSPYAY